MSEFELFDPSGAVAAEAASVANRSRSVAAAGPEPRVPNSSELLLKAALDAGGVASVASVANFSTICRAGVKKLQRLPKPSWEGPLAWAELQADAAAFERCWLDDAIKLGWSIEEMFGCWRNPRAGRLDAMGLVPILSGRAVMEVTERWASIRGLRPKDTMRYQLYPFTGATQRFDRSAAVPIWIAYDEALQCLV